MGDDSNRSGCIGPVRPSTTLSSSAFPSVFQTTLLSILGSHSVVFQKFPGGTRTGSRLYVSLDT